jgi:hypothetical protein
MNPPPFFPGKTAYQVPSIILLPEDERKRTELRKEDAGQKIILSYTSSSLHSFLSIKYTWV